MGIQINGNTDSISASDGNLSVRGNLGNLTGDLTGNVNAGIVTASSGYVQNIVGNVTGNISAGIATVSDNLNVGGSSSFVGNIGFSTMTQLYGDGTELNPFKGLEGANFYARESQRSNGNYYISFDGVSYYLPFIFDNYMINVSSLDENIESKAWMKVTSDIVSIYGATTAQGHVVNVNPSINSSGIITLDYLAETGCGDMPVSYGMDLPIGCEYNYIRFDMYRPHSIHQCTTILSGFDSSTMNRPSPMNSARVIAIAGAESSGQFSLGGTFTVPSKGEIVNSSAFGMCAWNNPIFAYNGGSNAAMTTYTFEWLCCHFKTPNPFNQIGITFACANESGISQTNTTHEYWIAV